MQIYDIYHCHLRKDMARIKKVLVFYLPHPIILAIHFVKQHRDSIVVY